MSRARVPASLLKRLDALDAVEASVGPGFLLVPPIMGLDEWEALAMPMQRAAFEAAREDTELRPATRGDVSPPLPEPPSPVLGYSLQTGIVRTVNAMRQGTSR
jgi:hypothetical protein